MKKFLLFKRSIVIGLFLLSGTGWGQVIISQYIETSAGDYPKGIELWNVSAGTIDFSVTPLHIYQGTNGAAPSIQVQITTGTFAPGAVIVIGTPQDASTATGFQDFVEANGAVFYPATFDLFGDVPFDGNDALVVYYNAITVTDVFGTPGSDPGTGWIGSGVQTYNQNISIKTGIETGDIFGWIDPSLRYKVTTTDNSLTGFGLSPEIIWSGTTDTDWNTATNWTEGVIPGANYNVSIPADLGNYPILTGVGSCHNLEIAAGGALTVSDAGTFNNGGTATIHSDATQSGSLILVPGFGYSGTGIVTYNRYMTGNDWHLSGSPTIDITIDATFLTANAIIGMKDYVESADNWSVDYTTSPPGSNFTFGKGYVTKLGTSGVVSFTGNIDTQTENITLTRSSFGWNLLSNPYTSAINATVTAHTTDNLITANTAVFEPSYAALYIWDQASISYLIINNAGGGTLVQNYLQVGQGFFVKSKVGGGTFTMTPAMQSSQTATAFKSGSASSCTGFTLNAETSTAKASTQISYQENSSRGLDVGYDAGSFKSNPNFALYSRLVEDNGVDFGIQSLPIDYENLVIPIGLTAKAGDIVKFSASALNIPEEYAVVLEDRTTNTFTNLSDVPDYSIQLSSDIDGTGRFFIRTSFKSTLGIDNPGLVNPYQVFTKPIQNQLLIRGESLANTTAHIYSITGKLVTVVGLKQTTENTVSFNENSGIYIVKISNEQGSYAQKFSWVK